MNAVNNVIATEKVPALTAANARASQGSELDAHEANGRGNHDPGREQSPRPDGFFCDDATTIRHWRGGDEAMSVGAILIVVLILVLLGVLPRWNYSASWGYGPSGIVTTILVIALVLLLLGRV